MDDDSMGGRFWLKYFAILIAVAVAVILCLVFISGAFARWGIIGGFIVLGAVLLVGAWFYDKREAKQDAEWGT
jgi:hypothetical protein